MKLNKIFGQHKAWLTLTTVVAIFLLLPVFAANAEALSNYVGKFIFYILFAPFVALFELEMIILPIIAQFNNFTKLPGIVDGWVILRDLSNMFFIVVLLFMAFATILKFQSYGYKELLKTLIIMAILINFSKTIAGLLIDIGQVVMLTFVAAIKDVAAGNLTSIFGVDNMVTIGKNNGETISAEGSQIVLAYLLGGIMMMLASIVVMAFIVMLVMRIVFLWVLVVLSPLAFLANTFPATKRYFSEWLGSLTKEIIVGPVLIFFLWLSLSILNSSGNGQDITSEFKATSNGRQQQEQKGNESFIGNDASIGFTEAGKWDNVLKFIIAISMLIGSLKVTQGMGSKAMAYGVQAADKLKSGASKAYKFAGNRAWKGSTGEGGLSGGLQRAGSAIAVPTLRAMGTETFGIPLVSGVMTRASARLEGAEDQRKQRKQSKIEDRYKYIRDERKAAVYSSRGGNYSKRALDKFNIEEGNLQDMSETDIQNMVQRAQNLNDKETVKKIKAQDARAYTSASQIEGKLDENGAAAVRNINPSSLIDSTTGALTTGGGVVVNAVASRLTAEQIQTMLKGMTEQNAQVWRTALGRVGAQSLTASGGALTRHPAGHARAGQLDRDSIAYRTATLDNDVYDAAIAGGGLNDEERNRLSAARVANMSERQVLNIQPSSATWRNLASNFTEAHRNQIAANGTDAQVDALVQHGNLIDVLNNQNIQNRNRGRGANMQPQITANITNNISNMNADRTRRGAAAMTPAEELDYKTRLATNSLPQAHLMLSDPELTALINRLDVNRAQQIDGVVLRRLLGTLSPTMRTALEARGIN